MAEFKGRKKKKQPRNTCFLGCFGFSDENSKQKKLSLSDEVHHKKRKKWFSFGRKQRSSNRKVVADASAVSPPVKGKRMVVEEEIQVLKGDKKLSTILRPVLVNAVEVSQPVADDQLVEKANKTKYDSAEEIVLEESTILTKSNTTDNTTLQEQSSSTITKSTARRTLSHPALPQDKSKPNSTTTKVLSHSLSFPPTTSVTVNGNGSSGDQENKSKSKSKGRFDSLVGMSILLVTLMIMLFWGKVCAIVCTCAWFYFVPRITSRNKQVVTRKNDSNTNDIQLNSEEYKKKVVLEGLLQRNHRNG